MAKKQLTTKEKLELINNDPVLWLGNYVKIVDNNNNLVPFVLNEAQRDFVKNKGRYNIINKTRQLGMSTLMLGLMLHSSHKIPNSNYLMVADKSESVQNLFTRLKGMYESLPDNIRLGQKKSNKYELMFDNGSRISVQVAGYKELGRSFACLIIHCSELAFWQPDQQERGLVSLEQALLKTENAFMCIESTPNGIGNEFYRVFTEAERGNSRYKAFFYGWAAKTHREMFKFEIEEATRWFKAQNHGVMIKADLLDLYPNEMELYENYDITLKQILWRRYKISGSNEDAFNQEFPINAEIGFIQSDVGYFNALDIQERYHHLQKPLSANELTKDLPSSLAQYLGKGLNIYKNIERTERYFGGCDTSAGVKGDYSSISIYDSSGYQMATFNRNDVPVYKFAKIVYDLGMYFNYCMYAIERNSYGLSLIDKLRREMQYLQVLRFSKFDKIRGVLTSEYGFYTDNVSKTKLLGDFKEVFETGIILINDKETLEQMKIYVNNDGKLGNQKGKKNFDDLVDASALAVQSLKANVSYL